jgi:hypothetical protein
MFLEGLVANQEIDSLGRAGRLLYALAPSAPTNACRIPAADSIFETSRTARSYDGTGRSARIKSGSRSDVISRFR